MKYLIFGSVASALMLYGMSFIFGATGTLELADIAAKLDDPSFYSLTLTGCILLFAGLGFKISMAPFHVWAPDVYEGAPTPVTAFLTVGPKALGFAVLIRVFAGAFHWFSFEWAPILMVLSILTMTIGNMTAVAQTNIKRLLAYSSIAQAGYILMGLAASSLLGLNAVLYYLLAYAVTNLGVFAVTIAVGSAVNSYEIQSYRGLSRRAPFLAACMVVFLLSLAGIPPLAGFFAKLYVFSAVIEKRYYFMAAAAAINSAIAAYYYLRIIRQMYFAPTDEITPVTVCPAARAVIYFLLAGTLVLGLMPEPFILYFQTILPF
jgi:proton-translocating NADH-quinone oxidoreductase chain N